MQAVSKTPSAKAGGRRRSIRGKLTLLVLASVGVAVTLVTGVLAWRDGERETRAALDRLSSTAKVTAAMSEQTGAQTDRGRRRYPATLIYSRERRCGSLPRHCCS